MNHPDIFSKIDMKKMQEKSTFVKWFSELQFIIAIVYMQKIQHILKISLISSGLAGFICFVIMSLTLSCNKPQILRKDEAIDCLKILNGDLTNLLNNATERSEFKALKFLWSQKSSPLPFAGDSTHTAMSEKSYIFKNKTGIYSWNPKLQEFKKTGDTGIIVLQFPLPDDIKKNAELVISDFKEAEMASKSHFPLLINAVLMIDGEEALALTHIVSIENKLPVSINTSIVGRGYSFNFNFLRKGKVTDKIGSISAGFSFVAGFTEEIQSHFIVDIRYNANTYTFEKIDFDQKLFDTYLTAKIDADKINSTGTHSVDEFNKYSKINVSSIKYKKELGSIVLCGLPDNKFDNYCIVFSDGTKMTLSDQVEAYAKVLNIMENIRNLR
jgi:hypothetical protein